VKEEQKVNKTTTKFRLEERLIVEFITELLNKPKIEETNSEIRVTYTETEDAFKKILK